MKLELKYLGYKLDDTRDDDEEPQVTLVFRNEEGGKFTLRGDKSEMDLIRDKLKLSAKGLPINIEIQRVQLTLGEATAKPRT